MPVASLFLSCHLGKSYLPPDCAWIILMVPGCVLGRYPSRAIPALWPHWHGIGGLVSLEGDVRRLSDAARPYCLANPRETAANQGARFNLRKSCSPAEVDVAVG